MLVDDAAERGRQHDDHQAHEPDLGHVQREARDLYASLGFVPIAPYGDHDADMRDFLKFMELDLHGLGKADPDLLRSA